MAGAGYPREPASPAKSAPTPPDKITKDLHFRMLDLLHYKEGRHLFFEEIFARRHWCRLTPENLEQLGDYFRLWLTSMANEQDRDV
jgi:hypothetical protein